MLSKYSAAILPIALDLQMAGSSLYWSEIHPQEGGRAVVMCRDAKNKINVITPAQFNVRTLVHEHDTAAFVVSNEHVVYFSNFSDQRLYRQKNLDDIIPVTPEVGDVRFADSTIDEKRHRLICIREDHRDSSKKQAVNELVAIDIEGRREPEVLLTGNDFYTYPRVSPDGTQLAWVTWNNPGLPFFGCELWKGEIKSDGSIANGKLIAGSSEESVTQPAWSSDGVLHFVSDRTGWWNLYQWLQDENKLEPLWPMDAEFAEHPRALRLSQYAFGPDGTILCSYLRNTVRHLALLDTTSHRLKKIECVYNGGDYLTSEKSMKSAFFVSATTSKPGSIIRYDFETEKFEPIYSPIEIKIDPDYISSPEVIGFTTTDGEKAYGIYYSPKNKDYLGSPDELPPLVVFAHGGPTGESSVSLNLEKQFWTSRGFAVFDVNYGGSCGYGREYRMRLRGQWGVVDVDDCVNGALYLATSGKIDRQRMLIRGGSAGGYTVLCVAAFRNEFKAAASHFGISDLERMELETHKFERYYNDWLIGPYPEKRDLYIERSPLYSADKISTPLAIFQGLDDKVVPKDQAELMVTALRKNHVPFAYVPFKGEGHGFRRQENRKKALDTELFFFAKILGIDLPEVVEPIEIENLGYLTRQSKTNSSSKAVTLENK
jgi:dipeptidyl aminopeptidase/acylaminoacyl peptidase